MLNKLKKQNNEGFTIIEVMVVLAIAGLILVIVLLAVPALQRNSRNTAVKSDGNQLLGYVNDYIANNDGGIPAAAASSVSSGAVKIQAGTATSPTGIATTGKIQSGTAVTFVDVAATPVAVTPTPGPITVVYKAKCPDTITGTSVTPVSNTRSVAIIYALETSGGSTPKCVGS